MIRCLEFYCGIGGFAAAARALGWIVTEAIDINARALEVYVANFAHDVMVRSVESYPFHRLPPQDSYLWWMSPPCQPFTRRGKQRDAEDARISSFLSLQARIGEVRPAAIAMENVPEFATSTTASRLRDTLAQAEYDWAEFVLCPTQFGIPNRRRRFFLVASQIALPALPVIPRTEIRIGDIVDEAASNLQVDENVTNTFRGAIHIVDASDEMAVTNCFTSAYGRSPVRSGSYVSQSGHVRRFSPREILRLLGFPSWYTLPTGLSLSTGWKLVGNSVSVPVVTHVLHSLDTIHGKAAA